VLRWTRSQDAAGGLRVELVGEFDEAANLEQLASELSGSVTIDLSQVKRINSFGIQEWLRFLKALAGKDISLALERCSPLVVTIIGVVPGFTGQAQVRSASVSYYCRSCSLEKQHLIDLTSDAGKQLDADVPCDGCKSPMALDEMPQSIAWLREKR
jgi:anti-anti-sigma regulatory factor